MSDQSGGDNNDRRNDAPHNEHEANSGKSNQPSHYGYATQEGKNGNSYFYKVGAMFKHADGDGYNYYPVANPVKGPVVFRGAKERINEQRESPKRDDRDQGQDR